jgi:hypothetical protein
MATFYKFGKLWEIPPAAARLGTSFPANTQAFETFLTNLEPMYSAFICAHPRCPKDPDLPLCDQGVHGGAGAVKLHERTLGGVLRSSTESHLCFMVPGHHRLLPIDIEKSRLPSHRIISDPSVTMESESRRIGEVLRSIQLGCSPQVARWTRPSLMAIV